VEVGMEVEVKEGEGLEEAKEGEDLGVEATEGEGLVVVAMAEVGMEEEGMEEAEKEEAEMGKAKLVVKVVEMVRILK